MDKTVANTKISKLLYYLSVLIRKDASMEHQSKAYLEASRKIANYEENLCDYQDEKELAEIPSIGEVIAKDIIEYCQTENFKYL